MGFQTIDGRGTKRSGASLVAPRACASSVAATRAGTI